VDLRKCRLWRAGEARFLLSRNAFGWVESDAPIAKINQHAVKQIQRIHPE
jgi:hypothetical protein